MLWDKQNLEPVELTPDRCGLALALALRGDLPAGLRQGVDRAGFDLVGIDAIETCLTLVQTEKPDAVFFDETLVKGTPGFRDRLARARATETLPVMPIRPADDRNDTALALTPRSGEIEVFLKTRALLRRARPSALRGKRHIGRYVLDESGFKVSIGDRCALLSKTDLCILGPFFDIRNGVYDRRSLECLAFAGNDWKRGSRSIDAHISRVRRHVRNQIRIDPLRPVRGIGYALRAG